MERLDAGKRDGLQSMLESEPASRRELYNSLYERMERHLSKPLPNQEVFEILEQANRVGMFDTCYTVQRNGREIPVADLARNLKGIYGMSRSQVPS